MSNRFTLATIANISNRTVFFDANIIIYLFWPIYSKGRTPQLYASIFGQLIKNKNSLAIDTHILSEVINRILRLEYQHQDNTPNASINFKSFRNSGIGHQVQKDIFEIIINKILPLFELINKQITNTDIKKMLVIDDLDFNDKIIEDICRTQDMVLLTHDADFSNSDIDILSANYKLK